MSQKYRYVLASEGKDGPWFPMPIADVLLPDVPPPDPDPFPDSPFVPEGYALVYRDEFEAFNVVNKDTVTAATAGKATLIDAWEAWNARHLEGNNDKAFKVTTPFTHGIRQGTTVMQLDGINEPSTGQSGGKLVTLPFTAGMISTELCGWWKYGYFEIRARGGMSKGHHVAAWLLHKDGTYNRKEVCETDIWEWVGPGKSIWFNHINPVGEGITEIEGADPAQWHTYGLLWEADRMVWYLDGLEVRRTTNVMPREAYLLLSIEIGGKWPGMPDASTVWPCQVDVDYWRVYQRAA